MFKRKNNMFDDIDNQNFEGQVRTLYYSILSQRHVIFVSFLVINRQRSHSYVDSSIYTGSRQIIR